MGRVIQENLLGHVCPVWSEPLSSLVAALCSENCCKISSKSHQVRGWSGGAMVLGKLPVPGRPTHLDHSRASGPTALLDR